jgi:putative hydrolase of the HAD superfamily
MTEFTARYLGVSVEEAGRLRETEAVPFGTTLKWLTGSHGLRDPEGFLKAVHPEDLTPFFRPDPELGEMLADIKIPRAILTNSPGEHALRVLRRLGIEEEFPRMFDIRYNGFRGKPNPDTYEKVLRDIGREAGEVLFIDDMPRYLFPFRDLGGQVLLIDEAHTHGDTGLASIREITGLRAYLENIREN